MSDEADKAYQAARDLIAQAKAEGREKLSFDTDEFRALTRLPDDIAGLNRLESLDVDNTKVADLTPLAGLTGLKFLALNETQVADIAPLVGLTALTGLWLNNTQVVGISPLARLTGLKDLRLNHTQVADIAPLAGLTGLTTLSLENTQVVDIAPLAGLTGLTGLWLGNTQVADITPLAGLTGLTGLWLNDTPVANIAPLAGLTGLTDLWLGNTQVTNITPLAGLTGLTRLWLDYTQVAELTPIAGLSMLRYLNLDETDISKITELAALTDLETLYLDKTRVNDLTPIAGLALLRSLTLNHTPVTDLSPLRGLQRLVDDPQTGLQFRDCAAAQADLRIADISRISDKANRARALFAYLDEQGEGVKTTPERDIPFLPDPAPAPMETELRDNRLRLADTNPVLDDPAKRDRARDGWQIIRDHQQDFAASIHLANYRPLASAFAALDRALGADFERMNEVGVGAAGQRLTRLAADAGLLASLPEGAGADLTSLAATVLTFAERFPRWVAYNTDAAPPAAPGVANEQPAFEAIAKALEAAEDVDEDVKDEYRDEFEATREAPQDEAAARGLLASTRELLRTLAEDALIGARLYAEGVARGTEHQVREFAAVIPGEVRKKSFWASVTIGYDLFFHKSAMLLALSEQFPALLGWLPAVLRALGAV